LKSRIFIKLFGLFVFLLVLETAAMEIVFSRMMRHSAGETFRLLGGRALWAGLLALVVALPVAGWIARRISRRLHGVVAFAQRVAQGELSARLDTSSSQDELSAMETALNQTAARLDESFAEIESRRQELAAMLDSMQEAVVAITREGMVRWSNAPMQRIAGTEIRTGRPLIHAVRDPELLACVRAALDEREMRSGRASTLVPGRVFEINTVPLPSGGALAVLHDVTRIEAAERSRRDFIANVSHELRTPLTSIQGYVETLIEDPQPREETTREFLGIILKNATRMNRLTEDLLVLAGIESPHYQLALKPKQASALIQDAIDPLCGIAADSGVSLEPGGAPDALVLADADAINQVFGNLIENALKYGKAGKRICLSAQVLESEVEFSVRDFGPGIASEHLSRIFERFYRIDKARSRESGGTGLGLAIVKHIVMAHGGRVWAESELGRGAAFHFTLLRFMPTRESATEHTPAPEA
jgi:two-component system phosphate regulon sensor histidine kinase PhoR